MNRLKARLAAAIVCLVFGAGAVTPTAQADTYVPVDVFATPTAFQLNGIDIDQATHDVYVGVNGAGVYRFMAGASPLKFGVAIAYNGIAVNSNTHTVYALNPSGNTIAGFSPDGEGIIAPFAVGGGTQGDLAIDSSGDVYAMRGGNNGIRQFTATGTLRRTILCTGCPAPATLSSPQAVDFDAAGNMYVADTGNNRVLKFTSSGGDPLNYTTIPPIVFSTGSSRAIAVNRSTGDVFVGGNDGAGFHIKGYDPSGVKFADFGTGMLANSANRAQLAVDYTTGLVYVTDYILAGESATAAVFAFGEVAAPSAAATLASGIAQTTATLNATVNPGGDTVQDCRFEYGPTESYGQEAQCSEYPGFGTEPVPVSAEVSGLQAATTYHYRVVATNVAGTSESADGQFTTLAEKPAVSTAGASGVGSSGATIAGTVDPLGNPVGACRFEYGTTTAYGTQAACPTDPGSGSGGVEESLTLTGLAPNTTYHYRLVAENDGGVSEGADQSFTTLPNAPSLSTGAASAITPVAASISGSVDPKGAPTSYRFEYGTSASYGQSTPAGQASGAGAKAVGASLEGLKPATTYHYRLVASSAGGATQGEDRTFTTAERPKGKLALPPTGTVKGQKASVALECRGGALAICEGSLVLRARVKQGIRLILTKIGEADYTIEGGKTESVKVQLNGNGEKVLSQAQGKTIGAIASADGHNRQLRLSSSSARNAKKRNR